MSATIIEFKPKPRADDAPKRRGVGPDLFYALLGVTYRQGEMAFRLGLRNREGHQQTCATMTWLFDLLPEFEAALYEHREQLLKNMDAYYPRAAKRLRDGKPPRRRRRRQASS
jgi:hypothetical protein